MLELRAPIRVRTEAAVSGEGGLTEEPEYDANGNPKSALHRDHGRPHHLQRGAAGGRSPFQNVIMDRPNAAQGRRHAATASMGSEETGEVVDRIKNIGFHYATQSGITIAVNDIQVPENKTELLDERRRARSTRCATSTRWA